MSQGRPPGIPNKVSPERLAAEERFAEEYVVDLNAKRAMAAAGQNLNNGNTRTVMGHRLLKLKRVQAMIQLKRLELSQRTMLSAEWVEKRLMELAVGAKHESVRLGALEKLGRRLPSFFEPETFITTEMTEEQREARRKELIALALSRRDARRDEKP